MLFDIDVFLQHTYLELQEKYQGNRYMLRVVIHRRNHLSIRLNNSIGLSGTFSNVINAGTVIASFGVSEDQLSNQY